MALTGKQRRHLRALGHHLSPVVQVGKGGISDGVIAALDQALEDHELIKVKLPEDAEREEIADELSGRTGSECPQILGRTLLLYRARKKDPEIELPSAQPRPARLPAQAREPPAGGRASNASPRRKAAPRSAAARPPARTAARKAAPQGKRSPPAGPRGRARPPARS